MKFKFDLKRKKDKNDSQQNFVLLHFSLLVVLVVIIFAAAIYFLIYPVWSDYQILLSQSTDQKEDELNSKRQKFNEMFQFNEMHNRISPQLKDKISKILPTTDDYPNLFYNLEQLAEESNYKLISVSLNTEADKTEANTEDDADTGPQVKQVLINLNLEGGGYLALKKFLGLVEENLRILDITSYSYDPEESGISFTLKTYFYDTNL